MTALDIERLFCEAIVATHRYVSTSENPKKSLMCNTQELLTKFLELRDKFKENSNEQ